MASQDDITLVNVALIRIGDDPIQSFEDGTKGSIAANAVFNQSRQYLLSIYPWQFNQKWAQLAQIDNTNSSGVTVVPGQFELYQYQLPSDCIRLNEVWYGSAPPPLSGGIGGAGNPYTTPVVPSPGPVFFGDVSVQWRIKGNTLLTNEPFIGVWYSVDIPDTLQWTPYFGELMIAYLAWQLCYVLAKSSSEQDAMRKVYEMTSVTARHSDSLSQPAQQIGARHYSPLLGKRRW